MIAVLLTFNALGWIWLADLLGYGPPDLPSLIIWTGALAWAGWGVCLFLPRNVDRQL